MDKTKECPVCGRTDFASEHGMRRHLGISHEWKYTDSEWLQEQYHGQNRSTYDIADECGLDNRTIRRWMDKFGIERRQPEERRTTHPNFFTNGRGYQAAQSRDYSTGDYDMVLLHRLLATLKVDEIQELSGKDVHHKGPPEGTGSPCSLFEKMGVAADLDFLDNLQIVSQKEHRYIDAEERRDPETGRFTAGRATR